MKKIILINLLVLLILFGILEFISYLYIKADAKEYVDDFNRYAKENNTPLLTQRYAPVYIFDQKDWEENMRKINIGSPNKGSMIFFGCSYTYGSMLEEENTLPYLITKKTNRTTVNRGIPGGSIINTLFDLRNEDFYKKLKDNKVPDPKYIVYIYINDHKGRVINPYRASVTPSDNPNYTINFKYKYKDGKLIEDNPSKLGLLLYGLYTKKAYHYLYANKFSWETTEDKFFNLMKEAKNITDEKFPNSEFIVIEYKDGSHCKMEESLKDKLTKDGFIVLDSEKLAGHELESEDYRAEDKEHPNGKAFNDVANGLIKELHL